MTSLRTTAATALALALMLGTGNAVFGQAAQGQPGGQQTQQTPAQQGMPMQPGMMGHGMGPGAMGQGGMWHIGPHMMTPDEMQAMMEQMGGMMGPGMGPGMMQQMQPAMMGQGMGPGMMGHHAMMGQGMGAGMMGHHAMMGQGAGPGMMAQIGPGMGGWSGLEGRRVVPVMQLSADDVRVFLERYLASLGNARLKVGKVTEADQDTITAEIVTVDDSLVESFAVDRHTGVISAAG
jgi:hypothetical protein